MTEQRGGEGTSSGVTGAAEGIRGSHHTRGAGGGGLPTHTWGLRILDHLFTRGAMALANKGVHELWQSLVEALDK